MLTLPKVIERPAQRYAAIRQKLSIPFGEVIGASIGELFATLERKGIQPDGPVFFKYNIVKMPELEIDFGVPIQGEGTSEGKFVIGELPAGRYAELVYFGHYDDLMEVNAVMIGWAEHKRITWDSTSAADGEHFASRLEIYHNGPDDEPDPAKWQTTLSIKVRD